MPTFEITAPDGRRFQVTGPEGGTAEQALAQVQATYKAAPPVPMPRDRPPPMPRERPVEAPLPPDLPDPNEAAAARVRASVGGRPEGRLSAGIDAVVPAIGQSLDKAGQHAKGLMTGEIEPSPENVIPAVTAVMPNSVAMRSGAGLARAAMTPAQRAQAEVGVDIPRVADKGAIGQGVGRVLANAPAVGGPLKAAARTADDQLAMAGSMAAAKPTGEVLPEKAAGHIRAALEDRLGTKVGEDTDALLNGVIALAKKPDSNALGGIRGRVPHADWKEVQGPVIDRLGRGPNGFDPATYVRNYNELSAGGKNLLFGDAKATGTLRYHLDSLAAVAERAPTWRKFRGDDIPAVLQGRLAKMGLTGLVGANPFVVLPTVLGMRLTARQLAKPSVAAPIAQWAGAYEKFVQSGGTPAAFATFKLATDNLKNSIGDDDGSVVE